MLIRTLFQKSDCGYQSAWEISKGISNLANQVITSVSNAGRGLVLSPKATGYFNCYRILSLYCLECLRSRWRVYVYGNIKIHLNYDGASLDILAFTHCSIIVWLPETKRKLVKDWIENVTFIAIRLTALSKYY